METQKLSFTRQSHTEIVLGNEMLKGTVSRILRLRTAKECTVITNDVVGKWYLQPLLAELRSRGITAHEIVVPDGEKYKNYESAISILNQLCELGMNPDCPIIALGGGVICDLAGFVASIYKRGAPLVLMPTSLLAMVDACVGGKTAINLESGKNLAGTFYQPIMTAIDVSVLRTLPLTQLSYGVVEAIKHGAIADAAYYKFIAKNIDSIKSKQLNLLQRLIRRSINLKRSFIAEDELDTSDRLHLNFGHTFGHALEAAGSYIRLHHAEAVGLGMLIAIEASKNFKLLEEDYSESLKRLLIEFNMPVTIPDDLDKKLILNNLSQDKKINQDVFCLVLPVTLGKTVIKKIESSRMHEFMASVLEKNR